MRKYPPPQVSILLFVFLFSSVSIFAQTRTLTGVVKDSANQPLVAATVTVTGTKISSTTAADGSFTLSSVPAGNITLDVTYIGYNPQSIPVGPDQTDVAITMAQGSNTISDVVVTALGIKKDERKLGYAVTAVSGDQLTKARETNIANSLEGQVAGLSVRGTNSGPGGTSKLLLRGMPSMSSGSPLYVINGVPIDNSQRGSSSEWGGSDNGDGINNINPDDVETMTVLKGQAASALYGARATNGVILITTKGGRKGHKDFSIEYNLNYMAEMAMDLTDFQTVYGQGDQGLKPTTQTDAVNTSYSAWGPKLDGSQVIGYDGKNYSYSKAPSPLDFYQTGNSWTNTLALSKSTESGAFRLGMSYLDNTGIVENSGLKRYNVSLNLDQNITDRLSLQVFVNYINQQNRGISYLSDAPMNVNNVRFLAPNIDEATLAPGYDPATGLETVVGGIYSQNPWFVVNKMQNNLGRKRLISSVSLRYNFTSWLYAQARVGYDLINDDAFKIEPWGTAYRNTTYNGAFTSGALQALDKSQQYELNVDGIIGANKKFNDIEVSAIVGGNIRQNQYSQNHLSGEKFIQRDYYSYNNLYIKNASVSFWETEVHSAYYSVDATYRNFLTVGTTGRLDAYSTMPTNSNTIFVPAVSAGFIFSGLLNEPGILQFGKLRASYANTSNELKDAYKTQTYYSLQGNSYYGIPLGTYDLALPNGLLKPFVVNEIELGTELHFFRGNRLNIDVAWYTKKTEHEIMPANISRSTGYASGYVGTGSTKNTGVEILVSGTILKQGDFYWKSSVNFTKVQNKVLQTTEDNSPINIGQARETLGNLVTAYVVGLPGPQIRGYDYKRDASGNIIVDASGLPLRTQTVKGADSLVNLGSVLPTLYGGWNNEFGITKNLNFSFLIDYNFGNNLISMTSRSAMSAGLTKETLEGREGGIVVDGITETGEKNTENVSAQTYWSTLASRITALHVQDGDFVKLRQVALTYTFSGKFIQKSKLFKGAQLSVTGRNLAILYKKADNIDPEESFGSSINYYGIEGRNLPSTRAVGFNLKVTF